MKKILSSGNLFLFEDSFHKTNSLKIVTKYCIYPQGHQVTLVIPYKTGNTEKHGFTRCFYV